MQEVIADLVKSQATWLSLFLIIVASIGINYNNRLNCNNADIKACPNSSKFCSNSNEFGNIFNIIVLVMGILMLILNFGYLFYNRD
mgnify:CR=1 FL=1